MKPGERWLIVNADDFGLSEGVNRGIIQTHEHGIVTSASLMVRHTAARPAADYARGRAELGVGLHLDLGEWEFRDGSWTPLYEVVPLANAAAVACEVDRQFEEFVRLMGRPPTHLDSHQHVHRSEPVRSIATGLASRLRVPLRDVSPRIQYVGNFYGQGRDGASALDRLSVDALTALLRSLPDGISELGCHPGDDPDLRSSYRMERLREVETLCDEIVADSMKELGVRLCHFGAIDRL